ncbi:hypothetical protein [Nocardia asiatica]|uniref:hypothetical protein n=1 Tax=Nocardia asiatica TaxID=209252 RepID=UPI0024572CA1|nr:hypothetical protein [Nocardia asiatica]
MSYPIEELPDLSSLGGEWTTATVADCAYGTPVEVGRAHFPDHEWPYEPQRCPHGFSAWYLNGTLLLCLGCGTDGT